MLPEKLRDQLVSGIMARLSLSVTVFGREKGAFVAIIPTGAENECGVKLSVNNKVTALSYYGHEGVIREESPFFEDITEKNSDTLLDNLIDAAPWHFKKHIKRAVTLKEEAMQTIYTDGSCLGNPGRGGFAVVFEDREISQGYRRTTNNRMELLAVITALEMSEGAAVIVTDSQYVVNGIEKWLAGWIRKGWRGSAGPVKNVDLWKRYLACARPDVSFKWVKGHAGNPKNERADTLAVLAAGNPTLEDEGYDA